MTPAQVSADCLLSANVLEETNTFQTGQGVLRQAAETINVMALAMHTFCERVEAGEIRSRKTYADFCIILGRQPKR